MINLLILFGGESPEHDVSNISAANILNEIDKARYHITTKSTEAGRISNSTVSAF